MGNVTISTTETTIYYPSDWLVEGGPPYDVMGCPDDDTNDDDPKLVLAMDRLTQHWQIIDNGKVVMDSTNKVDIAKYFTDYMFGIESWYQEEAEEQARYEAEKHAVA